MAMVACVVSGTGVGTGACRGALTAFTWRPSPTSCPLRRISTLYSSMPRAMMGDAIAAHLPVGYPGAGDQRGS